jgi:hypothetical protein
MFYKGGKKYLNVHEWCGELNRDYGERGIHIHPNDVHKLFGYFYLKPITTHKGKSKIYWYSVSSVNSVRFGDDFVKILEDISNGVKVLRNKSKSQTIRDKKDTEDIEYPLTYRNDENDMEKYSKYLENMYQTESVKKKIIISENAFKRLFENINDGIEWSKGKNGNINLRINSSGLDVDNTEADTRIFGTKNDILYGDNTLGKHNKTLSDTYNDALLRKSQYDAILKYAQNGCEGDLSTLTPSQLEKVKKYVQNNDVNGLLNWAEQSSNRNQNIVDANSYTTNKVSALEKNDDKAARYKKMKVRGTNVDVIALYVMNDFNFSDALKNGYMRQNGTTDKILGIKNDERAEEQSLGHASKKKIPITYDNGKMYDLASNFSLNVNNIKDGDHFKQNYQSKEEYNSVKQFLDKSIIYANYALKEEGFNPDYIVAAPSSSDFNKYYCINLSNKMGVPYVEGFFKRNLINVRLDENLLKQNPLSEQDEMYLKQQIKAAIYGEIATEARTPIINFVNKFWNHFSMIRLAKNGREFAEQTLINDVLSSYVYKYLSLDNNLSLSNVYKTLLNQANNYSISKKYNTQHLTPQIINVTKKREVKQYFMQVLEEVHTILSSYSNKIESGFKINATKFKITKLQQRFRHYLNNVYVICDEALNKDKNLLTRYQNAKYLIFDEDINSGATLKLVIDALQEKTFGNQNNIMCLVNAYSASGF